MDKAKETHERNTPQRVWTDAERVYLENAAGKLPLKQISEALERSTSSITAEADCLELSLDCPSAQFVWCDKCATWRTRLNVRTGWCRVCTAREQLRGREEACAEALFLLKPNERAIYEKTEAERQTKRLPPHPVKRFVPPIESGKRSEEDARYLAEVEEWECRVLKLRYDAAKTRLRRMRQKSGSNPRKPSSENE